MHDIVRSPAARAAVRSAYRHYGQDRLADALSGAKRDAAIRERDENGN